MRCQVALFGALLICFGAPASIAQTTASNTSSPTTIHACVGKHSGIVRIVASPDDCVHQSEYYIQWDQQGPTGATGPAGAPGPAGPAGPQGPAGPSSGQTFTANSQLNPNYPSGVNTFTFTPISGIGSANRNQDSANFQQFANSCTASNFTVTAVGATGSSEAIVSIVRATTPGGGQTDIPPICTLTSNNGQIVSCTAAGPHVFPAGSYAVFITTLLNAPDFDNAFLITSFTCQ